MPAVIPSIHLVIQAQNQKKSQAKFGQNQEKTEKTEGDLYLVQQRAQSKKRLITKICDWAKYENRLQFKKYMSNQTVLFPK